MSMIQTEIWKVDAYRVHCQYPDCNYDSEVTLDPEQCAEWRRAHHKFHSDKDKTDE